MKSDVAQRMCLDFAEMPEPHIKKLPIQARVAILAAFSTAVWTPIIGAAMVATGTTGSDVIHSVQQMPENVRHALDTVARKPVTPVCAPAV